MQDDIVAAYEQELNKGNEQDTPPPASDPAASGGAPPPTQTQIEQLEYYLDNKPFKLPMNAEVSIKRDGKFIREPLSSVMKTYSQAAHLNEMQSGFKKERETFEAERGKYKSFEEKMPLVEKYEQLDTWFNDLQSQNPAVYEHLVRTIEAAKTGQIYGGGEGQGTEGGAPFHAVNHVIQKLQTELGGVKSKLEEYESQKEQAQARADREETDKERDSLKKDYPEINLDEVDPSGIPLWTKIERWGVEKGYQTFTDAYYGYFRDRVRDILVQRGKNEALKQVRKDHQEGIIFRGTTPLDGQSPNREMKFMNEEERLKAAKADFAALTQS